MDEYFRDGFRSERFTQKILEFEVDETDFRELCDLLRRLSEFWQGHERIDKEIAWLIFDLPKIVMNASMEARRKRPELADRILDMALEIDDLVLNCFYDAKFK